jgi:hypothetical protein
VSLMMTGKVTVSLMMTGKVTVSLMMTVSVFSLICHDTGLQGGPDRYTAT